MMSRLERTQVGQYVLADSAALEDLEASPESYVRPISEALADMPAIEVDSEDEWRVLHGLTVTAACEAEAGSAVRIVASGELIAIGVVGEDRVSVKPKKVLADLEVRAEE
jgi:tRNA U55 pseudouridine synthase TruB